MVPLSRGTENSHIRGIDSRTVAAGGRGEGRPSDGHSGRWEGEKPWGRWRGRHAAGAVCPRLLPLHCGMVEMTDFLFRILHHDLKNQEPQYNYICSFIIKMLSFTAH